LDDAAVRIFELAELPRVLHPEFGAVTWLDGDLPQDPSFVERLVRLGFPYSNYRALVAVEEDHILGRIETVVLPFRTRHGSESVLGVTGVVTRPDELRHGVASSLLQAAHARERSTGRRWSFLWTHRSWGAHELYERLGYRDVYSPPSAVRKVGRSSLVPLPPGYRSKSIQAGEAAVLQEIFRESTRSRSGFLPRFPGSFAARFRLGWRRASDYVLLVKHSEPVGYAFITRSRYALGATEVIVRHPRHVVAMVDMLERKAAGLWLAFGRTTFITDNEELLQGRGFLVSHRGHATLMARPLRPDSRRPHSADPSVVCQSAEFSFHSGDVF
jgi:GNAT superfamily N-acetyltransferase